MAGVTTAGEDPHIETPGRRANGKRLATLLSRRERWLDLLPVILLVGEMLFLFFYRQVNLDEGWYLWASKLVYEGKVLYRDFAYTQTPVLPYVYGLLQSLLGDGLYQGRSVTLLLSLAVFAVSAATARKIGGPLAGRLCLALLVASVFALAQYSYTATYALAALLLAVALHLTVGDLPETRRNLLATLCITTAVGVRLSVIAALPPFLLYLIFTSRRPIRSGLLVIFLATLWLGAILGLFWLLAGEKMSYDILGFHTDRLLRTDWQQLRIRNMAFRTRDDFGVLMGLCIAAMFAGAAHWWRMQRSSQRDVAISDIRVWVLLMTICSMALALFLVHLLPRTTDSYYNALQAPMMTVAGGVILARWFALEQPARRRYLWGLVAIIVATHAARQGLGFLRDRYVTYPFRDQIAITRSAAELLRSYTQPGDSLLSFSPHLALEAGLRVPSGYEMAIFAYRPTWSDAETQRYNVVNNTRLLHDLQQGADAVALTTFDLEQIHGIQDSVLTTLHKHYRWFATVPGIGPYNDDLRLYLSPQYGIPKPSIGYHAAFADHITLLGFDLVQRIEASKPVLAVALYWRATEPPSRPYTVFVQLLKPDGEMAVGWDNQPCRNTCPTSSWQAGEFLRDEYELQLVDLAPGVYTLQVGMYDPLTIQRVAVINADGQPIDDRLLLSEVEITEE
jgi:hypothetical protein